MLKTLIAPTGLIMPVELGIRRGTIVRVRSRISKAVVGQTMVVAAVAVADGLVDVLDDEFRIIKPEYRGVLRRNRLVDMLTIDAGPQYQFLILPQAARNRALAAKPKMTSQ